MDTLTCAPCKARGKDRKSSHWCVTCEEPLCSECTETHTVLKATRNHQLSEISKIPKQINISDQFCSKHDNLPYEYFCIDHDVLSCKECIAAIHRPCKNVMSIDIASKMAKKSQSFTDALDQIKQILYTIDTFVKDRTNYITDVEQDAKKIKESISEVKREIITYIDSLERSLLQDLQEKKTEIISSLQDTIDAIQNMATEMKEKEGVFKIVEQQGTDKQAFLLTQSSKDIIGDSERKLTNFLEKATTVKLCFNKTNIQDINLSIGKINKNVTPRPINYVSLKQRQSQVHVVTSNIMPSLVYKCDVDMSNVKDFVIRGMVVNEKDELIICDFGNFRLLVCDQNNKYKHQIETTYKPWDIDVIPGTTIVVLTSFLKDYIQFIDTERKKVMKEVKVKNSGMGGITVSTEHMFVGAKGKIHVLDHQGRSVRIINIQDTDRTPWFMSLGKNGNMYYTTGGNITCIQPDGTVVFTKSDVGNPRGIQTDNNDNVYVVNRSDSDIHRFRSDGKVIDQMKYDVLHRPLSLCFNREYTKIYVVNNDGYSVSCFKIE